MGELNKALEMQKECISLCQKNTLVGTVYPNWDTNSNCDSNKIKPLVITYNIEAINESKT